MKSFDADCRQCDRLANFLDEVKIEHADYFCRPVPAFGDTDARLLVVGLAPGKHGANRSGRPFTGDHAGILLYQTLYDCGLSTVPTSDSADDDLQLLNCRITNAVKCLPPQNKPTTEEMHCCNAFLKIELEAMPENSVVLALGGIAHKAVIHAFGLKQAAYKFGHAAEHVLSDKITLLDSYHCSRYNTQTKRLTADMFHDVFVKAAAKIAE